MSPEVVTPAEQRFLDLIKQARPSNGQSTDDYLHQLQVAADGVQQQQDEATEDAKIAEIAALRAALRASNYSMGPKGAGPLTTKAVIDLQRAKATAANLEVRTKRRALIAMGAAAILGGIAVATGGGGLAAAEPIIMPIIDKLVTGLFEKPGA